MKHLFTLGGAVVALGFIVVFFSGRIDSKPLSAVAPRVGMSEADLAAIAPRVAAQTGATVGTARRLVYLLACNGLPTRATMEAQAATAAALVQKQRVGTREAALEVLKAQQPGASGALLGDC